MDSRPESCDHPHLPPSVSPPASSPSPRVGGPSQRQRPHVHDSARPKTMWFKLETNREPASLVQRLVPLVPTVLLHRSLLQVPLRLFHCSAIQKIFKSARINFESNSLQPLSLMGFHLYSRYCLCVCVCVCVCGGGLFFD